MTLANLPSPNYTGADLSARVNAAVTEARAARRFATVDALLADTTMAYGTGARAVAAGDRIEAGGHRYAVAASGATDHHLTTAGGVKLTVLPVAGAYDVAAFAAPEDGTTDATAAIQRAIDAAKAGSVRRILLGTRHKITDLDLTKLYYCGLVLEGANLTHQPSPSVATLIVSGTTSRGLDLSGTSGLILRNISIRGDSAAPPRCAIFAQRVVGSPESFGHVFDNLRTFGSFTDAAIYNHAGENWTFRNCILWSEGGSGRAGYFTTTNSIGRTSKFQTPDTGASPLTVTVFRDCDIKGTGASEAMWFEQQEATSGDRTIQNILFDHCYSRARGFAFGAVFRFSEVFGGVTFRDCTDESYAQGDATAAASIIQIDGSRVFRGLRIMGCQFYPRVYVVAADVVQDYTAINNWVSGAGEWWFDSLTNGSHETLFAPETFRVTTTANLVDVLPGTRASLANILLPSNRMSREFDWTCYGDPTGNINPERRNTSVFNAYDSSLWVPVGSAAGVDSYSWRRLMTAEPRSSLPTSGTYEGGALIWKNAPAAGGKIGWVCLTAGTFGTLNGGATTGSISSGSTTLTVNSATGLALGQFITIAGVSGRKRVVGLSGKTVTIDSAAGATVTGAAVAYYAPVFKEWGIIDA